MADDFECHTQDEQATSLAQYLDNGKIFQAKTVIGTTLRKLLLGLALQFNRVEKKIKTISSQYDIFQTTDLLTEWESAVGIPDDCFTGKGTIAQRRVDVFIKLRFGLLTEQDYIDLGKLLGTKVKLVRLGECQTFPLPYPLPFCSDGKVAKFTLIIQLDKSIEDCLFPIPFPLCFRFSNKNEVECVFRKLSPANVRLIFEYVLC